MNGVSLQFDGPVTLAGGGALDAAALGEALALAPVLIAADGAADRLAALGRDPVAVIGDMDSLADPARWGGPGHEDGPSDRAGHDRLREVPLFGRRAPTFWP